MNLQEFTKTALVEIVSGIGGARVEAAKLGATVGLTTAYATTKEAGVLSVTNGGMLTLVEFDIALAEAVGKDTNEGIGVFLDSMGKGAKAAAKAESSSHSRIKFSVPIVFPGQDD